MSKKNNFPAKTTFEQDEEGYHILPEELTDHIRIARNGSGQDVTTGYIVYGAGTFKAESDTRLTAERVQQFTADRRERKTAEVYDAISRRVGADFEIAFGEKSADLWKELDNKKIPLEKRLKVMQELGKEGGIKHDRFAPEAPAPVQIDKAQILIQDVTKEHGITGLNQLTKIAKEVKEENERERIERVSQEQS